jgi:pyrroloquinoline quinone biosynthesis protein D
MSAPSFAKGVRFRRLPDGQGALLIPEGIVNLNDSAAAIVELIDGERSSADIAHALSERYGTNEADITRDVNTLLKDLAARTLLVLSHAAERNASVTKEP